MDLDSIPAKVNTKRAICGYWLHCRRRSGGGRTTCTGMIAANRTTTTGRSTGTYQLSRAVRSTGFTGQTLTIRLWYWWSLVVRSYGRDRSTSTETGAAVPGTPKLLGLFHDVLLLSESPNNHPEYTAPGLLNDPLNLRCDVTVWVLILAGLTRYPNHFLRHSSLFCLTREDHTPNVFFDGQKSIITIKISREDTTGSAHKCPSNSKVLQPCSLDVQGNFVQWCWDLSERCYKEL